MNLKYAALMSLIVPVLVVIFGDGLYVGLWYYFLVPFVIITLHTLIFKLPTSFYTGLSLGICFSFLFFLSLVWFKITHDSLIGLLHLLFVLPGIIITITLYGIFATYKTTISYTSNTNFLIGLFTTIIGFIIGAIAYILFFLAPALPRL